jgi:hypothetical protein
MHVRSGIVNGSKPRFLPHCRGRLTRWSTPFPFPHNDLLLHSRARQYGGLRRDWAGPGRRGIPRGAGRGPLLPLLWGHDLLEGNGGVDHSRDVDLVFAPDGRALLLTGHQSDCVRVWDGESGTPLASAPAAGAVATVKAVQLPGAPQGAQEGYGARAWRVFAGGWSSHCDIYDLTLGAAHLEPELRPRAQVGTTAILFWRSFSYYAEGRPRVVVTTQMPEPGAVVIDGESGDEVRVVGGSSYEGGSAVFHAPGPGPGPGAERALPRLVLSTMNELLLCDPETGEQLACYPHRGPTRALAAFPDPHWEAGGEEEGEGQRWLLAATDANGRDGRAAVEVREVHPPTLAPVRRVEMEPQTPPEAILAMAVISWCGEAVLAVATKAGPGPGAMTLRVTLRSLETGQVLGPLLVSRSGALDERKLVLRVVELPFERRGLLFASSEGIVRLWGLEDDGVRLRATSKRC